MACRDVTSNTGLPTGSAYPTRDDDNNLLTTEFGLCIYKNHQVITMQVCPCAAPCLYIPCCRAIRIWFFQDVWAVIFRKHGEDRLQLHAITRHIRPWL